MIIGVDTLPHLPTDPADRNRTSPFAFTGDPFEFRAPGSGQTVAVPMIMLNTIMAESLDYLSTILEKAVESGDDFDQVECGGSCPQHAGTGKPQPPHSAIDARTTER